MNAKTDTQKSARSNTPTDKKYKGFDADERAAMKQRMKELKANASKEEEESAVLAAIEELPELDRLMARRLHALIKASMPALSPKLWYGMPAYAMDGKNVCFFQPAKKFKTRYATLGFSDMAKLDEGNLWPVAYALKELTAAEEARISALVKKAVG